MSSFFTLPASQKKRKRIDKDGLASSKKQRDDTDRPLKSKAARVPARDESISGSDSDDENGLPGLTADDGASDSSEHENETAAEKRLRLAERYLENLREEIDEGGFDAADLDRDLIAERLKEDVSETKGKLYRFIASDYDFAGASATQFRGKADCTTSITVCPPYIYTATKDRTITKWELPPVPSEETSSKRPLQRRPTRVARTQGSHKEAKNSRYKHHSAAILSIAASQDGKYVVTGGADKRLIVWSAEDLTPLRVFTQHRDSVLGLAFRRGTNQLYSGSADRTIKTWSLNELAYVETLFGHQDHITDVAALSQERCLSAGARDRTVRLWKVVEETQLVFRGGGSGGNSASKSKRSTDPASAAEPSPTAEGSIERVAFIDDETFVSGSDNGSISLWTVHKKKPIFTFAAAHGFDPPPTLSQVYADIDLTGKTVPTPPQPRWITALVTIPYTDLIVTGSWDGHVRAWRISQDKKKIEPLGAISISTTHPTTSTTTTKQPNHQDLSPARGVVNDLDIFERGIKGQESLFVVAALGKEHRLGRWKSVAGGKNGAVVFEIRRNSKIVGGGDIDGGGGGGGDGGDVDMVGGDGAEVVDSSEMQT